MSKIVPFPAHRKLPAASPIPHKESERLAELALDIVDRIVAIMDEGDGDLDCDAEPNLGAPRGRREPSHMAAGRGR